MEIENRFFIGSVLYQSQIPVNGENIFYIYDAFSIKQQKVADGTTTAYAGGYTYENSSLKFISHPEGYIEPDGAGGYDYVYQYKDHLGNTRLSYTDTNDDGIVDNSEIMTEKNYYPYGLSHQGYNNTITGVKNNLKTFQGQEFTEGLDLNVYEWKYRFSDPAIGRFWQIDPLAEKYAWMTTYQFSSNQPIHAPELEGKESKYDLNSQDMGLNLYKMTKQERKQYFEENKPIAMIGGGLMLAATGGFMVYAVGTEATVAFIANEVKDEALSQATGGASDVIDITKTLTKLGKKGLKALSEGTKSNLKRFEKKVPSNSKESVEVFQGEDGITVFTATSPGKVEGSKAIYTKTVDTEGTTVSYTKTTIDPNGNTVHVKDKITGKTIIDNSKKNE